MAPFGSEVKEPFLHSEPPFFKCSLKMQTGLTQWNFSSKGTEAMKRAEKISEVEPGLIFLPEISVPS